MVEDEDLNDGEFRLPTAERIKQSKKRRAQQLRKYIQLEKQLEKESGKRSKKLEMVTEQKKNKGVKFPGNITLLEAAARNDKEEIRRLLQMGISPDVCNDDGLTALHQCCIDDSSEMLKVLLEFGAKVNATDCELWTPLHAAATCGRINLCQYLIERGADLLAVNGDGNMPYDICEHEPTLDYIEYEMAKQGITQELIDETRLVRERMMLEDLKNLHLNNGDLEFRGRNGETPLHIAAANGYLDVAEFLLSRHIRVDVLDNDLWQPIHCAACWGQLQVLELLLEHGASLESKTSTGVTPLDICDDIEMRQKILEIKDDIENSRIAKSREISRRHSSTIRSASVRRTSMREKNEMSWKEAKEEARRMRESTTVLQDPDDDEVEKESSIPAPLSDAPVQSLPKPPKGILLSPLVSVEEILDNRPDKLKVAGNLDKKKSYAFEAPSPKTPELTEYSSVGRGNGLGGSSVSKSPGIGSEAEDLAEVNNCMTGDSSPSQIAGTLLELKKQRSSNRLTEAPSSGDHLKSLKSPTDHDRHKQLVDPSDYVPSSPKDVPISLMSRSPSKEHKTVGTKNCCMIL